LPNQRKYRIDVANQGYNLINKNFLELERNVFFDVASKWLDVWIAQNQIRVIEIAKNNADTLAKINALRLKNQVISETDLIRTQLLSEQYAVQLKSVRQDLLNKRSQLRFLIGTADSVDVDLTNEFLFPESINIDTLLRYALANRSDIQQIQSMITLSESNIKFQRAMALPQPELGMIWNPQNTVPYVGFFGTIELPIFSRNQGEIQKSTILKKQAEQNYVTVQTQIQTEISTAYKSFIVQQQNIERFAGILQQAQSILDRVRYAYLRGGTTIIDFLEAQRSWLETQQQYYDAQQQYRQSYIQLLFVSGLINQLAQ
jgi:cobalt-zinc-cadmium efflux system outer membrane protein